jgi:hypothetical protein
VAELRQGVDDGRYWRQTDLPSAVATCLLLGQERKWRFGTLRSVDDPSTTLAVRYGIGFNVDFCLYESTR